MTRIYYSEIDIPDLTRTIERHFPHKVKLSDVVSAAARDWCYEMIGISGRGIDDTGKPYIATDADWYNLLRTCYFKDPDHAVMFRMVWG